MKRPVWKFSYIHPVFFKSKFKKYRNYNLRIRNSVIPGILIGHKIGVYNGIWNTTVTVIQNILGLKFGMFSFTRCMEKEAHEKKKIKKKQKKI